MKAITSSSAKAQADNSVDIQGLDLIWEEESSHILQRNYRANTHIVEITQPHRNSSPWKLNNMLLWSPSRDQEHIAQQQSQAIHLEASWNVRSDQYSHYTVQIRTHNGYSGSSVATKPSRASSRQSQSLTALWNSLGWTARGHTEAGTLLRQCRKGHQRYNQNSSAMENTQQSHLEHNA